MCYVLEAPSYPRWREMSLVTNYYLYRAFRDHANPSSRGDSNRREYEDRTANHRGYAPDGIGARTTNRRLVQPRTSKVAWRL